MPDVLTCLILRYVLANLLFNINNHLVLSHIVRCAMAKDIINILFISTIMFVAVTIGRTAFFRLKVGW